MKITFIMIFLSILSPLVAQSYIRVSNNPGAIADYTNLQTAIDNAPVGATIFVEPSTTNYGSITITKRITLFGGGYDASKHNNKSSSLNTITLSKQTGNPSKTIISGINIVSQIGAYNYNYNKGIDSITIQRCQIASGGNIQLVGTAADSVVGWKIINCRVNQIYAQYSKNIVVSNNIIGGYIATFDQYSVFFTNNVFAGNLSSYSNSFMNFSNNVFYYSSPAICSNCTFSNNLVSSNCTTLNYGDNVSTNNIEGVAISNIFVTYGTDYHLKSTCPGVNAGSDGKDIGIYGGLFPFPDVDYGITGYPEINSLNITNPLVEPNGTLKVNVKSKIIH